MCLQVIKEVKIKKENHVKVEKKKLRKRMKLGRKKEQTWFSYTQKLENNTNLHHFKIILCKGEYVPFWLRGLMYRVKTLMGSVS